MKAFVNCLLLGLVLGGNFDENFGDSSCPNDDLTIECTTYCLDVENDCREACDGNSTCINECDESLISCLTHCPCRSECPNGCNGCSGVFCQCQNADSNEEYLECEAHFDHLYNVCVVSCPTGDFTCNANCFREYTSNLEFCPCQSGCPNGCPCNVYQCPETTTAPSNTTTASTTSTITKAPLPATEVLVLHRRSSIITNAAGRQDTNFDFVFDGTEVDNSCSMTWQNNFYIFGGAEPYKKRQIAQLIGCRLTSIGYLDFNHTEGACANVADEKLYLCFNGEFGDDHNQCRVALSPTGDFEEINQSSYGHLQTRIAASEDDILALGSWMGHKKAEMLRTDRNTWSTIGEYPDSLAIDFISHASIIYTDGAFYVFGGYDKNYSSLKGIGKLDATTKIWSKVGDLTSPRSGHNVIFNGAHFLFIGGAGTRLKTEKCTLVNGQMTCAEQNPELTKFAFYPELYLVPLDFCEV